MDTDEKIGLFWKTVGYKMVFLVWVMSEQALEPDKMTTIKLHASVRIRLASHARKDQTYEALIIQLLDKIEGEWLNSSIFCNHCKRPLENHSNSELVNCSLIMINEVKT